MLKVKKSISSCRIVVLYSRQKMQFFLFNDLLKVDFGLLNEALV